NNLLAILRILKNGAYVPLPQLKPVMAYPEFPEAVYTYLLELSKNFILPNIDKLPVNSITLLENNQSFIEAFMVGMNHEMARELLWNEYPTDQRGSYFRQFWDVSMLLSTNAAQTDKEKFRDIPELHKWSPTSALGKHNYREQNGPAALLV